MKVGIAISGGGYRATSFGLGTLSYLNHLQFEEDPLLKKVIALSTVSGGSIVGITYAQWTKAGLNFEDYFKWLYEQITTFDLITDSINKYVGDKDKNSLIEGFSSSYEDHLLTHRKFWSIQPSFNGGKYDSHLLFYSINSTDFNTGTPFRFIAQDSDWSEYLKRNDLKRKNSKGELTTKMQPFVVGNGFFKLKDNIKKLPLNVVLASSSCFPGGFEPIILRLKDHITETHSLHSEVALMDGGIVDNQGLDAIIDFQEKIPLDLVIVVDSASPDITKYSQSEPSSIWLIGNCKIGFLSKLIYSLTALFALALIISLCSNTIFTLIFTVLTTVLTVLSVVNCTVKNKLNKVITDKGLNSSTLKPLRNLTPNAVKQLLLNRANSLESLVGSVFMKHIRRLNTQNLFEINKLNRKIIVNTLYQNKILDENEKFLMLDRSQVGLFKNYIDNIKREDPNEQDFESKLNKVLGGIPEISKRAFGMGTTLWVSKDEEGEKLVRDVIVTGQISTCVNIINNKEIINNYPTIHKQALDDWEEFKKDPYWLFDKLMANSNNVQEIFRVEKLRQEQYYNQNIATT